MTSGARLRSGMGCLIAALRGGGTDLVVVGDMRDGLPTSADESAGGDAGAAVLVGEGPGVLAELVATASATDEFTDRWRAPGDRTSKLWEERFGENRYLALGQDALARALKSAGVEAGDIGRLVVTGMHGRAVSGLVKKLGLDASVVVDDLAASVGQSGTAHPLLVLAGALESLAAEGTPAGTTVVALHLADGADAVVLRTTEALAGWRPVRPRRRAGGQRRGAPLFEVPGLAGAAAARAAPAARAGTGVEHRGLPQRGMEVRLRRLEGPELGRRPPATRRASPWKAAPWTTWSRSPWRTPPARWSPRRSTGWPTRRARPSCSPWWTSTGAVATRSS